VSCLEAVFVGYEPGTKGYQLWDNHTHSGRLRWSWDDVTSSCCWIGDSFNCLKNDFESVLNGYLARPFMVDSPACSDIAHSTIYSTEAAIAT
jgi:hypothetical protein